MSLKLVSWNVISYVPRAADVDALFAHEEIDGIFVCEAKQQRWDSGTVKQLDFDGTVISMESHNRTSVKSQVQSMGILFLSNRRGII